MSVNILPMHTFKNTRPWVRRTGFYCLVLVVWSLLSLSFCESQLPHVQNEVYFSPWTIMGVQWDKPFGFTHKSSVQRFLNPSVPQRPAGRTLAHWGVTLSEKINFWLRIGQQLPHFHFFAFVFSNLVLFPSFEPGWESWGRVVFYSASESFSKHMALWSWCH